MSDDWTLRTLLGNFADLTPPADGWYTDPNWDPDGVAVAFGGQPIIGSGTIYPPSGAGLYVQRVATNGAPVGQPTTVATIAIPGPENGMRPDWNGTPVCTGARDAGSDMCQPAPTATVPSVPNLTAELVVTDGIPYQERLFTLTVSNNSGASITDLSITLYPFTASPDAIPFVAPDTNVPFRYILRQSGPLLNFNPSALQEYANNLTISAGGTLTFVFTGHSKRSGLRTIDVHLASAAHNIDVDFQLPIDTKITALDFDGADAGYKAAIFWALFNETSEGNMFAHDPEGLQNCMQNGWTIPNQAAGVLWVVRRADSSEPQCRELLEMDIQVMLNGILRYERQVNSGGAYKYFTSNYKGSLGNNPPRDNPNYYFVEGDLYTGSNTLWMDLPQCWPLGSTYDIENIRNPPNFPADRVGYKVVLDPTQNIATLPSNFNREAAVVDWLRTYLECAMGSGISGDQRYQWQYAFYQQTYLGSGGQQGVIAQVLVNLVHNCSSLSAPLSLDAYLQCDPANGGVGRVSATKPDQSSITQDISNCVGATPSQVLSSGTINFLVPFQQQMAATGSPDYTGGQFPIDGYRPSFPTVLLPVVFFSRDLVGLSYSVRGCHWETLSYPRAFTPFNYPR